MKPKPTPPKHLAPATRKWFRSVMDDYELEGHHVKLLTLAAEAWDRCLQAREAIAEHGLVQHDRFGKAIARPETVIERDSRLAFARLLRELALDVEPEADIRPARLAPGGRASCQR